MTVTSYRVVPLRPKATHRTSCGIGQWGIRKTFGFSRTSRPITDLAPQDASIATQACLPTGRRPANDVRIDCKAAKHSDGDRGPPSADCSSRPTGRRANKGINILDSAGVLTYIALYEQRTSHHS